MTIEYKFQFNNDTASCSALADLIRQGWSVEGFRVEDGYTWFLMQTYPNCPRPKEQK